MHKAESRVEAQNLALQIDRAASKCAVDVAVQFAHFPADLRRIMLEAVARKLLRAASEREPQHNA